MTKTLMHLMIVASMLTSAGAQATPISIDGDLADWGLTTSGTEADWTNVKSKSHQIEDQTGGLDTYLTPGYGGQAYDAEALYVDWDNSYLYIALVTGHNPTEKDGKNKYAPGDFAIDFGADGIYEFGLETTGNNNNVFAGLYTVNTWGIGLWGANNQGPTSIINGQHVATNAQLAVSTEGIKGIGKYGADTHYFYEAAIPVSAFAGYWKEGTMLQVHWTMNCANDSIMADPPISVPEPGTLALLPLGLLSLLALRRRKTC